jgi:hypothetical protein
MKKGSLVRLILCLLSASACFAQAPDTTKNVRLTGSAQTDLVSDRITGMGQGRPPWVNRLYLYPTLEFYGYKLGFSFLLSSEEKNTRQPFDRFGGDVQQEVGLAKGWMDVKLGDAHPKFSHYTLDGILVRGGSADLNPGLLRMAVAMGRTQRAIEREEAGGLETVSPSFRQNLFAAKLGFGKKAGSHFDVNVLKVKDDPGSIDSAGVATPKENAVFGTTGQLDFGGRFLMSGEWALGVLTRDVRSGEVNLSSLAGFPTGIIKPRLSTQYGTAYTFGAELRLPSRKASGGLKADYRRVDQGFASLGSPNLLNDIQGLTLQGDASLLRGLLGLRAGYEQTGDNVERLKPSTTRTTTWSGNLDLLPARLPYLTLGYSAYGQKNDEANDTLKVNNLTGALTAASGVNFALLGLRQNASLSYSYQDFKDKRPLSPSGSDYKSQTGTWSHAVDFPFPISASYSLGLTQTRSSGGDQTEDLKSGSAELAHRAFRDRLRTRVQYVQEKGSGNRLSFPIDQMKTTYRAGPSWNGQRFNAGVTWERIRYDDRTVNSNSYSETVVTTSAGTKF